MWSTGSPKQSTNFQICEVLSCCVVLYLCASLLLSVEDVLKKTRVIVCCALILGFAGIGWSIFVQLHQPKIGVVDNNALIAQFSEAVEVRKIYDQQVQQWESNLKALEDSLKSTVDLMASTYERAPKSEQQRMRARLDQLNTDYRKYANFVANQKDEKLREMLRPLGEKLDAFLTNWARENGYDILLGPGYQGGVILSASKAFNVTKLVLADLNKEYPPKVSVPDSTKKTDSLKK